jgi:hypothetical protein
MEAVMTEGPWLAPYFCNDALADDEARFQSLRQFAVALIVGFALLASAGLIGARAPQAAPVAATDQTITQPEAPRSFVEQPDREATRG